MSFFEDYDYSIDLLVNYSLLLEFLSPAMLRLLSLVMEKPVNRLKKYAVRLICIFAISGEICDLFV